jgi:hypothetical protein
LKNKQLSLGQQIAAVGHALYPLQKTWGTRVEEGI